MQEVPCRSAPVGFFLGKITVFNVTADSRIFQPIETDMNKRRLRGAHSVFKSVFDQSDKQQRSDQHTFPIVRQIDLQLYISRQPQTHQLDITLHEIQFMIERYEFLIVFIHHKPHLMSLEVHNEAIYGKTLGTISSPTSLPK